jgi:tetratricopeptide (TPR) repeat protein
MSDTPGPDPSTVDPRFEAVVEEFLREREEGRTPDPQRYLDSFPELASALRGFFAGQDLFDRLAPDLAPGVGATPAPRRLPLPALGQRVGGFELLEEVGRGGMGVVYRARQTQLGRVVALKMIRRGQEDAAELARFRVEAESIARLSHPNIVQVFEVGEYDGTPFVALEYCGGGSLAERLRGATLRPAEAAAVVVALARAMQAAHQHNVIHRDLKPANVLLAGGDAATPLDRLTPKVSDFGLARKLDDPGLTQSGVIMGTPSYMAPEQARGQSKEVGPAVDVYALGAVLYECLTGRPPFQAATALETLGQVLDREPVLPRQLNPVVPRDLETVSLKCLRKEPQKRYPDAAALADDLGRYLDGRPVQARRVSRMERLVKWVRRRPAAAGLAAALVLLAAVGLVVGWSLYQQRAEARGRQQQTDAEARTILARGRDLLAEGWKAAEEAKLKEAVTEGDRAAVVARRGEGSAAVIQETSAFQDEARARLGRWRKNERLRSALLDVANPAEVRSYSPSDRGLMMAVAQPSVDEQYAAAFRRWGLDVDGPAGPEVVARVRAEPDAVVQDVIASLDGWTLERRQRERPEPDWRRLQRIVEALDHSTTRRRLRRLLLDGAPLRPEAVAGLVGAGSPWAGCWELARGEDWRHVQELRGRMNLATEPVLTVVLLAYAASTAGDRAGAAEVLRAAAAARPEQLVLLRQLAAVLDEQQRWEEAIGCYRAMRVRRPDLGIALGQTLVRVGRGGEGEWVVRDLLRQKPDNPDLHAVLGEVLGQQRKFDAAETAYRQAIRLKPDFPVAYCNLGAVLSEQGKSREAEAACRDAIRLKPRFPGAYCNLGHALNHQGKAKEAEAAWRDAIRLKHNFPLAHSNLAVALHQQGRHEEAEAASREALRFRPDFHMGYCNLGHALNEQGKHKEAEAACRQAIRLKHDVPEAHVNLGVALVGQGRHSEAETAYRQALRLQPSAALTHLNLGVALAGQGRDREAETAYRHAILLKPSYPEAYSNLGNLLWGQKKAREAEAAYREAIRLKRDFPTGHNGLALVLNDQGRHKEAEEASRTAIRLKPNFANAHYNLGVALRGQGRPKEAEAALREAIRLKDDLPGVHYTLGAALIDQGRAGEAEAECRKAIQLEPSDPKGHVNLGAALGLQGKYREAETALREAIRLAPNNRKAHVNLGNALRAQDKAREAEAAYRAAIRLEHDVPEAHRGLGWALGEQGKHREAETALREAIRLRHDYLEAHIDLGAALSNQGKDPEAEAAYREAVQLQPDYPEAHGGLGNALLNQGKAKEAEAPLREAIRLKHDYPEAHYHLGIALMRQGKPREAEAAYRAAIRLMPDFPGAFNMLGNALRAQDKLKEAEAAYRQAIRLKHNFPQAHVNLGFTLRSQGRFAEALEALRQGDQLGRKQPGWSSPSEQWVRVCERLVELDRKLPAIVSRKAAPADPAEALDFAALCRHPARRLYAGSARLAAAAFAADAGLADDLRQQHRYNAAGSAALAGTGHGEDARGLPDEARAKLRRQALTWLQADLAVYARMATRDDPRAKAAVRQRLTLWQQDSDFASVRDRAALARLPEGERADWEKLWQDVRALQERAGASK